MTKLYLTFSERRTGGEPLDSGPWSDRAPTYIEFSVTGASAVEVTGWNVKTLNVDFDAVANRQVVLVIVRYRDGDTFGYSTGNWEIVGATPRWSRPSPRRPRSRPGKTTPATGCGRATSARWSP